MPCRLRSLYCRAPESAEPATDFGGPIPRPQKGRCWGAVPVLDQGRSEIVPPTFGCGPAGLPLCGSIRAGDCHRGGFTTETQRTQRRPVVIQPITGNLLHAKLAGSSGTPTWHCRALLCVLCVTVVQFGTATVIEGGIHHRDAENTEKTLIYRRSPRHAKDQVATLPFFAFLCDLLCNPHRPCFAL